MDPLFFPYGELSYNPGYVENEGHLTVTQNRGSAQSSKPFEDMPEGLDHRLALSIKGIHNQSSPQVILPDDDDLFAVPILPVCPQHLAQTDVGQGFPAQIDDPLQHAARFRRRHFDTLDHRIEREYIGLLPDSYMETFNNCQRERQSDGEGRTLSFFALNGDCTAQGFDVAPDDIHPYPTP